MSQPTLWYQTGRPLGNGWRHAEAFNTDEHPHPTLIHDENRRASNGPAFSRLDLDDAHKPRIWIDSAHIPDAPELWYLLIPEQRLHPTQSLCGFADRRHPPGRLVTIAEARPHLRAGTLTLRDAATSIRWGVDPPEIEQIYVHPAWRRRGLAIKIINAADIVAIATGQGFLTGGTHTTSDGEHLRHAWSTSTRVQPREGTMPPMDST